MDMLDLPSLASRAALGIEFHLMRNGVEKWYVSIKELSSYLENFSKREQNVAEAVSFSDFIWPRFPNYVSKQVGDVYLHLNLLSKDLRDFKGLSIKRQEELRDYCVELSRWAMANEPRHYYRFAA